MFSIKTAKIPCLFFLLNMNLGNICKNTMSILNIHEICICYLCQVSLQTIRYILCPHLRLFTCRHCCTSFQLNSKKCAKNRRCLRYTLVPHLEFDNLPLSFDFITVFRAYNLSFVTITNNLDALLHTKASYDKIHILN